MTPTAFVLKCYMGKEGLGEPLGSEAIRDQTQSLLQLPLTYYAEKHGERVSEIKEEEWLFSIQRSMSAVVCMNNH